MSDLPQKRTLLRMLPAIPAMAVTAALAAGGCSGELPRRSSEEAYVLLRVDSSTKAGNGTFNGTFCLLFAITDDGRVAAKDSSLFSGTGHGTIRWKLAPGTYRIWGVCGCSPALKKSVWDCNDAEAILDFVWSIDDMDPVHIPALADIDGEDGSVCVLSGKEQEVKLCGHRSMARIALGTIQNGLSTDNVPSLGNCLKLQCRQALLVNVPLKMTFRCPDLSQYGNDAAKRSLDTDCECVRAEAGGEIVAAGEECTENLHLYSFPNTGSDSAHGLVLAVGIRLSDGMEYWYNIPVNMVNGGFEYAISRLTIMKKGAATPFDLTPTDAFDVEWNVRQWSEAVEQGLAGKTAEGPLDYSLDKEKLGLVYPANGAVLEFSRIYGESRVSSSDENVVFVRGAGKKWFLTAATEGYSRISIFDGVNEAEVDLCAGNSLKWHWTDWLGGELSQDRETYTWQRCTLTVDKWFSELDCDTSDSGLVVECIESGSFLVYPVSAVQSGELIMNDRFDTVTVRFPGRICDWSLLDCGLTVKPKNCHLTPMRGINAVLEFPFALEESAARMPLVTMEDRQGNVEKYQINCSTETEGKNLKIHLDTSSSESGENLGVDVICSLGNKKRKLFTINKCGLTEE